MKNSLIHFCLLNKDIGTKSVIHYRFFYEGNKLNLFDHKKEHRNPNAFDQFSYLSTRKPQPNRHPDKW